MQDPRPFKVAAVSSNTNSFGLYQHVLVHESGEAWTACASQLNRKAKGSTIQLATNNFAKHGFEIPNRLPEAPENVLAELFVQGSPAEQLRAGVDDENDQRERQRHTRGMENIKKAIQENRRKGSVNVLSLRSSVVEQLEKEGFGVKFHRAAGMGDMDTHTVSW